MKIIENNGTVSECPQEEVTHVLRHSAAHIMAQAIQRLYPDADFAYGPATERGFYYDVDLGDRKLSDEDLVNIENEMKKIVTDGVTEKEFNQTKNGIETAFVMQLQSIGSRADSFNSYVFYSNGQTNFPEGDLNRYRKATIESMMATVRDLFSDDSRRSTLIVVPKNTKAPKDTNAQGAEPETGATP